MQDLRTVVWDYYHDFGRDLPWRQPDADGSFSAYKILVSEIMLQQTQVSRVLVKYQEFLKVFPDVQSLASATLGDVLRLWSGLGYNRRAKFLWQAAQMVVTEYAGVFPQNQKELTKLPGVGINTAGAICAYTWSQPVIFIETNIRTVYIHHFFGDRDDVHDKELVPFIEKTIDQENSREFYWALMDYGSFLKKEVGNISRSSRHYSKQSKFEGSKRQLRGRVLRVLANDGKSRAGLESAIADERLDQVITDLISEGLIVERKQMYRLA